MQMNLTGLIKATAGVVPLALWLVSCSPQVELGLSCGMVQVTHITEDGAQPIAQTEQASFVVPVSESPVLVEPAGVGAFGIGYAVPNLADEYAPLGATWAKLAYQGTRWDTIEPNPPVDGVHTYVWDDLDTLIAEYQGQGFTDIHLTLEAKSEWGSRAGCANILTCKPSPPKPEYWADYLAYVRAVVERYDKDGGPDDMTGLLYPVRTFEVESEADSLWQGSVDEYLTLLQDAYQTITDANPDAQVSPAAMYFYNLFSGQPDAAEIERRLNERPSVRAIVDFDREVLRHPDLFDFVQFHGLGGYDEDQGVVAWLRAEMAGNGYQTWTERSERQPAWLTDAVSGPPLIPMGTWGYLYDRERARHYLDVIKENIATEEPSQEYRDIMAWYRAEQARFAVKRTLIAMGLDLGPVLMGPLEDWPNFFCTPLPPTPDCPECPYNFYSWAIYGMYEIDHGPLLCFFTKRDPVAPYPVFYSLQLLLGKLAGATGIERLDWGPGLYAYRLATSDGRRKTKDENLRSSFVLRPSSLVVLWYDDGLGQMVGEGEGSTELTFTSPAQQITVSHIITQTGHTRPEVETIPVVEGRVTLEVTETPIFVEGELAARCAARVDLDCDCNVDVVDINHAAARWGSREGDSTYERTSDLNGDGQIDVVDVMTVAARWGATCPTSPRTTAPPATTYAGAGLRSGREASPFGFLPASVDHPHYPDRGFADAENIGVRWHRPAAAAFWFLIQPDTFASLSTSLNDPTYDWSLHDQQYGSVPAGIHILANISPDHWLHQHGYTEEGSYVPIDEAKYRTFVRATVDRYDGDGDASDMPGLTNPIRYWQVDNEPRVYLTGFADLQRITYQAIKDVCPDCTVLIGGSAGFPEDYIREFDAVYGPILSELAGPVASTLASLALNAHRPHHARETATALSRRHSSGGISLWT